MTATEELDCLLPHRRPMTMLAEALPEKEPGTAEAVADTSERCIFFDPAVDGVPSCAALEYMAQTMAIAVGRERRRGGKDPAVGFVLGSRRIEVSADRFKRGARYVVRARCDYTDGEFASFACDISGPGGETVATATLTAFQPSEEQLKEAMR